MQSRGFRAAYWPLDDDADAETIDAYAAAAAAADVVIAEIGAWSNPISPDERTRAAALELCKRRLALADRVGARCCVTLAGSRGDTWDGPHPDNLSRDTFALIVDSVREIVDAVEPRRTFYTLEPMPWTLPDSPDSYLELMSAIDRRQFAVHLDPTNLINSPAKFYDNAGLLRECFAKLGPHIKCCHAKDITLAGRADRPSRRGDPRPRRARLPRPAHRDGPTRSRHADPGRASVGGAGVRGGHRPHPQRGRGARRCGLSLAPAPRAPPPRLVARAEEEPDPQPGAPSRRAACRDPGPRRVAHGPCTRTTSTHSDLHIAVLVLAQSLY